jgi:predicted enzyme related to lactoylglutathione lyase
MPISARAARLNASAASNRLVGRFVRRRNRRCDHLLVETLFANLVELEQSRRFYEEILDVEFAEERHGDGPVHLNATFGEWNTPSGFLMSLWPNPDRAGTVDIGFLVKDVDQAYERALSMGAGDVSGPRDIEGVPRNAEVTDPSGNHIGLYQG